MKLAASINTRARVISLDEIYQPGIRFTFLQIDAEIVAVDRGEGTTALRIDRGQLGTTRASHSAETDVVPLTSFANVIFRPANANPSESQDALIHLDCTPATGVVDETSHSSSGYWRQGDRFRLVGGDGLAEFIVDSVLNAFEMNGLNQGAKTFTVLGDATAFAGQTIHPFRTVDNLNDINFTCLSAVLGAGPTTVLTVAEAIPSPLGNGWIGQFGGGAPSPGEIATYSPLEGASGTGYSEGDATTFQTLANGGTEEWAKTGQGHINVDSVIDAPPTAGNVTLDLTAGIPTSPIVVPFNATAASFAAQLEAALGVECTADSPDAELAAGDTLEVSIASGGGALPISAIDVDDNLVVAVPLAVAVQAIVDTPGADSIGTTKAGTIAIVGGGAGGWIKVAADAESWIQLWGGGG